MKLDKEFFKKNGYIVLKNVFPDADIKNFQHALRMLLSLYLNIDSQDPTLPNLNSSFLKTHYESLSRVQRVISRTPQYFKLISNPVLQESLTCLLELENQDPLYNISNGIIFSGNKTDRTERSVNMHLEWHNDIYYTIPNSNFIQIWAPMLEDANEYNGALKVAVGSHKENILEQNFNSDQSYIHRYTVNESKITEFNKVSVPVKLNDVMIFDGRLVHASGINKSSKMRVSMIGLVHNPLFENFSPLLIDYMYNRKTPEQYFQENNVQTKINEKMLTEQLFELAEPPGGV